MSEQHRDAWTTGRRDFLLRLSGAAASGLTLSTAAGGEDRPEAAAEPLPTIALGKHRISRLIAGWNPIDGHSHTTRNMARHMREYFTLRRTVQFLRKCETCGITGWQYDHTDKSVRALRAIRQQGSKLKVICLHAERARDATIKKVIEETAPVAIVHHGGVTDGLFRTGKQQQVHDFLKKVHDHGLLAGVSTHNPENLKRIADAGWENDLFMTCFYYVSRPRGEQLKLMGKVIVGEPYLESDPLEMTRVVRQVDRPCLGFKILAAGRLCWNRRSVQRAFQFAFKRIKPTDGVIVGMFPRYHDEVAENVGYTRKFGAVG